MNPEYFGFPTRKISVLRKIFGSDYIEFNALGANVKIGQDLSHWIIGVQHERWWSARQLIIYPLPTFFIHIIL